MADQLVKRTVLVDRYAYMGPSSTGSGLEHTVAFRGDEIEVSEKEAARGEGLGGLGSPEDHAASVAMSSESPTMPDEQLKAMNAEELVAYIGQHPGEAERLQVLEEDRGARARKSVLSALDDVVVVRNEAVADEAQRRDAAAAAQASGAPTIPTTGR